MLSKVKYKKSHILLTVIQVVLAVMISGWYYYSERKMGMLRHILYRNVYKFPKYFSDTNIKLLIVLLIVCILIQLILVIKSKKFVVIFILNTLLTVGSVYIILNYNSDKVFIYYYIIIFCALFNLARFCQFLTLKLK